MRNTYIRAALSILVTAACLLGFRAVHDPRFSNFEYTDPSGSATVLTGIIGDETTVTQSFAAEKPLQAIRFYTVTYGSQPQGRYAFSLLDDQGGILESREVPGSDIHDWDMLEILLKRTYPAGKYQFEFRGIETQGDSVAVWGDNTKAPEATGEAYENGAGLGYQLVFQRAYEKENIVWRYGSLLIAGWLVAIGLIWAGLKRNRDQKQGEIPEPLSAGTKKTAGLCFLSTLAFMIVSHGFMLMNPSYSHDSLNEIIRDTGMFQATLGRFAQSPWKTVFGTVTAPWYIGMITTVMIGAAAVLLTRILELRKPLSIVMLCGVLVTNYTVTCSISTYLPWVDTYGGALLLTVCGIWLTLKYRFGPAGGIVCTVISLGLYPPYIICAPALTVLWTAGMLISDRPWKKIFSGLIRIAAMLLLSYALYRVLTQWILDSNHLVYAERENSMTRVAIPAFSEWGRLLSETYRIFFEELFRTLKNGFLPVATEVVLIASVTIMILTVLWQNDLPTMKGITAVILFAVIPFVFNAQYFLCSEATYHPLMVYSVHLAFVLPILLYDHIRKPEAGIQQCGKWITAGAMCLLLLANIRSSNNIYTARYLGERMTLSLMTRVMSAAEQTDGYIAGETPIVMLGTLSRNPAVGAEYKDFEAGFDSAGNLISATYNIEQYMRYYMGYSNVTADESKKAEIMNNEAYQDMKPYPNDQFAKVIDGYLAVKLSDD